MSTSTSEAAGELRHGTVRANGLNLHYVARGSDDAPALLFVGGIVQQCRVWDPITAALPQFRCVALDLRGQGDSDWTRDGYSLPNLVADIHEVADRLDLSGFGFVGHSLGARVAMAYAADQPARLRGVALSDTGPGISRERALGARRAVEQALELRGFRDRERAREFYRQERPDWDDVFYDIYARHQYRENWAGRLVPNFDPDLYWITSAASLPDIDYLRRAMDRITVPTLIMLAKGQGSYLNPEIVAEMRAHIRTSSVVEFDSGHYIALERPAEFTAAVATFFAIDDDREAGRAATGRGAGVRVDEHASSPTPGANPS